jgi:hypothetical protein
MIDERNSPHQQQIERWEIYRREQETVMRTIAPPSHTISQGSLIAVEVMGIPGKTGSDAVLTYEAHADVEVGDMIKVPAPGWTIRVTGHDELPGFVLGLAASAPLDKKQIRTTLPLAELASVHAAVAELGLQVAAWRAQAMAFRSSAESIDAAADTLEAAIRGA